MTSPFVFVPRAVSKYTKEWQGIAKPLSSPSPPPDPTTDDDDDEHKSKGKVTGPTHPKQSTLRLPQDIVSLISLALSDYNIWHDADFRWKLDVCLQDDVSPNDAGFVPINYLLRRVPFRGGLSLPSGHPEPSETEVVKALRAYASCTLEVRMRLPFPVSTFPASSAASASSVWYSTGKTSRKKDVGGYEVRRRDWATLRAHPSRGWTLARWDDLTVYMECIPPQYRNVGGVARFTELLLSEVETYSNASSGTVVDPRAHVQCVTLPPHYLDKPGDAPKSKGCALVTFSTKPHLESVLRAWPWLRHAPLSHDGASRVVKEARMHGLRAVSKARWNALNEEYLTYKQALVDEVARAEAELEHMAASPHPRGENQTGTEPLAQAETYIQTTASSPYPFDCVIFVRHIHQDTNKTTLKSLFTQAFQDRNGAALSQRPTTTSIDYVDFHKGMDTCHLRLVSPSHTTRLLTHFEVHLTTQAHGLDATGRAAREGDKPIAMERIRGRKEELYWEGIPEKVKRQAVQKLLQAVSAHSYETESAVAQSYSGVNEGLRKKRTRGD